MFLFSFLAVPEPFAFYPLNGRYKATEKENRQPQGILGNVGIANGPYNEPGGAYMFYGNASSYIEFPNNGGLDTRFSITLMCWVQPAGHDRPLFSYGVSGLTVCTKINAGKFYNRIVKRRSFETLTPITTEVLPVGKWVHVAASYDHNSGHNSLYINGHLRASQNIDTGYEIATASQKVRMGVKDHLNRNFIGKITEMKIYDVALNEAQIKTSIRQGSCTFPEIMVALPSPVITLLEFPLLDNLQKVADTHFRIRFRKTTSR